jgi:hypothetical protein
MTDEVNHLQEDPRRSDHRHVVDGKLVDEWEPGPVPDSFGREPTAKAPDPRIRKPRTRRKGAL